MTATSLDLKRLARLAPKEDRDNIARCLRQARKADREFARKLLRLHYSIGEAAARNDHDQP